MSAAIQQKPLSKHVLEQLAGTNPDAEIWWDSSPLIYQSWKLDVLAKDPDPAASGWTQQLARLFDVDTIKAEGRMGFRGVTTNPPLSLQAIKLAPELWAGRIRAIAKEHPGLDVEGVYWLTYLELVRKGAEMILPVFKASGHKYGFISGQVDPRWVRDGRRMLEQGLQIAAQGENVMVKLPGSKEGYEVLEELTARGIATNNTTSFTVPQYLRCMAAVSAGLLRAKAANVDTSR
jgi:transaldolase